MKRFSYILIFVGFVAIFLSNIGNSEANTSSITIYNSFSNVVSQEDGHEQHVISLIDRNAIFINIRNINYSGSSVSSIVRTLPYLVTTNQIKPHLSEYSIYNTYFNNSIQESPTVFSLRRIRI